MSKLVNFLSFAIWPFGILLSHQFRGHPIYLLDIVVGMIFLNQIIFHRKKIVDQALTTPLFIFAIVCVISLSFNWSRVMTGNMLYTLGHFFRLLAYPFVYFQVRDMQHDSRNFLQVSLFIFLALGLLQYLFLPDMRFLKNLGFDDHYYRLIGTIFDPNYTGAIFAASTLYFLSRGHTKIGILYLLGLVLTFSRASFLGFTTGLLYLIYQNKNYKLIVAIMVLALGIMISPKPFGEGVNLLRTFSIYSRLDSWGEGIRLFLEQPLIGWGYNTLVNKDGGRFPIDSSFILILATTGITGFTSFLYLLKNIWSQLSLAGSVFVLVILTHSFFNNTFFFIWIYFLFWVIVGLETKGYKRP